METQSTGFPLISILTLIFVLLKLHLFGLDSPVEHWSWWWVLSPIWISFLLVLVIGGIVGIIAAERNRRG